MFKRYVTIISIFISCSVFSQNSLGQYKYVVVPEQFEFQKQKDQFQLNSMTKFYLNKVGLDAYMFNEVPDGKRCDGLFADLDKKSKFFKITLELILKDCNGIEVYRSEPARTNFKEWEKAYPDALRRVFNNIEENGISLISSMATEDATTMVSKPKPIPTTPISIDSVTTPAKVVADIENVQAKLDEVKEEIDEMSTIAQTNTSNTIEAPSNKFSTFKKGDEIFILRKTSDGSKLYKENEQGLSLYGSLITVNSELKFKSVSGKSFDAYFDSNGNLTVFEGDNPLSFKLQN